MLQTYTIFVPINLLDFFLFFIFIDLLIMIPFVRATFLKLCNRVGHLLESKL